MPDIFLSYAREDQVRAAQVAAALKRDGYDVFWDKEIPPGRTWADFLEEKLSACKAVVVLWSSASTGSQWVREEARIALDKGKLIPAMLDAAAPPFGFGEVQAANLTTFAGDTSNPEWARLIGAVQSVLGDGPRPRAKAAPAGSGWQGGAATVRAPGERKKGNWLSWVGGGFLVLLGLGVVNALLNPEAMNPPVNPGPVNPGPVNPGPGAFGPVDSGGATISAAASQAAAQARANAQAASNAIDAATTASQQGQQAAQMAAQGTPGFTIAPSPQGTVAGNLNQVMSGQPTPVGLQMANGMMFTGLLQVNPGAASMNGAFALGPMTVSGQMTMAANGSTNFVGGAQYPNRFQIAARETGQQGLAQAQGAGVITYPDGQRYEGEYLSRGEGLQIQISRHGLGVLYSASGEVIEAGRFNQDQLTGPQ